MGSQEFLNICKAKVVEYFNSNKDKTDATGNLTVSDGMYYEITYNGDKNELYFDAYKKWKNIFFDL